MRVEAPTISVPQVPNPRSSSVPTITNFTVFKSVPFQTGEVKTGWTFLTSAQKEPTRQYCYYAESDNDSDVSIRINVATDERIETPKTPIKAFDPAAAKCVWFKKDGL